MPFINSKVNVKTTDAQRTALKERLGKAIEAIPGKTEKWLMVNLEDEQIMYFHGEDNFPMAYITVSVLGNTNSQDLVRMTGELSKAYGEVLGIQPENIYIKYDSTADWGWNGSNF